jgi:proliferating cell nuclear antigen PCNA
MSTKGKKGKKNLVDLESLNISSTPNNFDDYVPPEDVILEVRTMSGITFKNLLDTLKAVLTEANIIFTQKGLKLVVVDPKKQAVVHLFMERESFQFYHCTEEKVVLGVDIDLLYRTIKTNKTNDLLCLSVNRNNSHVLEISFENTQKGTKTSDKLSLRSLRETVIVDHIKYPLPTEIDSVAFQNICREMCSFNATKLEIQYKDNMLYFSNMDGEPKRTVSLNIKDLSPKSKTLPPQRGIFSLQFLKPFTKASNLSQKVRIYLKTNEPLTCEYSVDNLGTLKYLLSSEEDDE